MVGGSQLLPPFIHAWKLPHPPYLSDQHGFVPRMEAVRIRQVVLDGIPAFESDGSCRPYIEVYQDMRLLYSNKGTYQGEAHETYKGQSIRAARKEGGGWWVGEKEGAEWI